VSGPNYHTREAFDARLAARRANPVPPHPHAAFYSASLMPGWEPVVSEQLALFAHVGLTEVHAFVLGSDADRERMLGIADRAGVAVTLEGSSPDLSLAEWPALGALHKWACANPTGAVTYCHTKGVSRPADTHKRQWRRVMAKYVVADWRANLTRLAVADMVGCDWRQSRDYPHWCGNFFAARSDWLLHLEPPDRYRFSRPDFQWAGMSWRSRFYCETWPGSQGYHHIEDRLWHDLELHTDRTFALRCDVPGFDHDRYDHGGAMHTAAYAWVRRCAGWLPPRRAVLEVGSRDVNGSVRPLFPGAAYWGIDREPGPGVDEVGDGAAWRPADGKTFDCAICFPAGTLVSGPLVPIERVVAGDTVSDLCGRPQPVLNAFERRYSGDMVRIRVACLPDVLATPEHPILASKISRIHRGNAGGGKKSVYETVASPAVWKDAKDVAPGDWVSVPINQREEPATIAFVNGRGRRSASYPLTDRLAWLLGAYAAEGFTHYPKPGGGLVSFSLGATEHAFAAEIAAALAEIGLKASNRQSPAMRANNAMTVCVGSVGLCKVLDGIVGRGCYDKRVPDIVRNGPKSAARAFLQGLVEGDGCVTRSRTHTLCRITTTSKSLAYGALELLHKLGIHAGLTDRDKKRLLTIRGRTAKTASPIFTVYWSKRAWDGLPNDHGKIPYGVGRFIGGQLYLPVRKVSAEPVSDLPVYNIHTKDNTYGVPFTVHNCTEVLEHTPDGAAVCRTAFDALGPGGVFVVTAAGPGREPHSAADGGPLRDGEYYANVPPETLRAWLAPFACVLVDTSAAGDVYALAVKG
jgi:hypothetical protein